MKLYSRIAALVFACSFFVPPTGPSVAAEVTIEEWMVPWGRTRPRDPDIATDGTVWFTAQQSNYVGRLDAATGRAAAIKVPTPSARPYGIVVDAKDLAWFKRKWAAPGGSGARPYGMTIDEKDRVWFVETGAKPNRFIGFDPRAEKFLALPRSRAARAASATWFTIVRGGMSDSAPTPTPSGRRNSLEYLSA
jgi:streptogramin lyase